MENELSVILLAIVGAGIQLVFKYFPKLNVWFEAQSNKALIMVGVIAVVSLAYFGLSCTPLAATFGIAVACSVQGGLDLAAAFIYILVSQQTTYLLTR